MAIFARRGALLRTGGLLEDRLSGRIAPRLSGAWAKGPTAVLSLRCEPCGARAREGGPS